MKNHVLHCDEKDIKYFVFSYDHYNKDKYWDFFSSKEKAVEFVCDCIGFGIESSSYDPDDGFFADEHGQKVESMTEEKYGQLYFHWMTYNHRDDSLLFDPSEFDNPPKTKEQFVEYMLAGNVLTVSWAESPSDYYIGNCLMIQHCLNNSKEEYFPLYMEHDYKKKLELLYNIKDYYFDRTGSIHPRREECYVDYKGREYLFVKSCL